MLIKTTFFFLLLSMLSVSAQDEIPNKEELLGNWEVFVKDYLSEVREYILIASNNDNYSEKVNIKKDRITKTYNTKGIRCGNDHRIYYNRAHKYGKTSWVYNKESGILEISAKHILNGTFFSVKKLDSGRILLTTIK